MGAQQFIEYLSFSDDGLKLKDGNRGSWVPFKRTLKDTFGNEKALTLLNKFKVDLDQIPKIEAYLKKKSSDRHQEFANKKSATAGEGKSDEVTQSFIDDLGKAVIIRDVAAPEDSCFRAYILETRKTISENLDGIFRSLVSKGRKELVLEYKSNAVPCEIVFDPRLDFGLLSPEHTFSGQLSLPRFNTFTPVLWDKFPVLPQSEYQFFIDLIEWLVPDKHQRSLVFSWVLHAERNRNEFALVLYGEKGVGKSFFTTACKYIITEQYTYDAKDEAIFSKFNKEQLGILLMIVEEVILNMGKPKARFKALSNSVFSIEGKGENIKKNRKNFMNMLFTTNEEADIFIECDDRRFQVVDTAPTKPPVSITARCKVFKDEMEANLNFEYNMAILKGFRQHMIENQLEDYKYYQPDLNVRSYWNIVEANFNLVTKHIIEKCKEKAPEVVPLAALKKSWAKESMKSRHFPSETMLKRLCVNYVPMGQKMLSLEGGGIRYVGPITQKPKLFEEE